MNSGLAAQGVPLDLYEIAKAKAWRGMWVGVGMFFGGLLLGIAGAVTGFLIFFALILVIAGFVKFCTSLSLASDPTKRLINLGPSQIIRRQVLRDAERELGMGAMPIQTPIGGGMVSASWFAYHDKEQLVLVRREDIIWTYIVQKKRKRNIRMQTRGGLFFELEDIGGMAEGILLQAIAYAAPCAFTGFDPMIAQTPLPALVYEVDRRRACSMPRPY